MRKSQKELKRQHAQLGRDKKAKEQLLADLDARAHDVQVRGLSVTCERVALHRHPAARWRRTLSAHVWCETRPGRSIAKSTRLAAHARNPMQSA